MTTSIRSFCLAALLAAGSAWAQQQPADNPDNPHATQAKDKQGADVSTSTTHQQIDQAEKPNPDSPQNKDRDRVGSAGMDHDAMMQNATPQMILQKLHMANLEEIEMGKLAEQNGTDRVKAYAKTLQTDHTAADRQVKDLAQKKNITLSDTPKNPEMQKKMDEARNRLSNMKGAEFDRTFANRMALAPVRSPCRKRLSRRRRRCGSCSGITSFRPTTSGSTASTSRSGARRTTPR